MFNGSIIVYIYIYMNVFDCITSYINLFTQQRKLLLIIYLDIFVYYEGEHKVTQLTSMQLVVLLMEI